MLTLDQCINSNRPLTFVITESDVEVLMYINRNFSSDSNWYVYSTTFGATVNLNKVLEQDIAFRPKENKSTTTEILDKILKTKTHPIFDKHIILEGDMLLSDKQTVRRIKDIVTAFQLDSEFPVNLVIVMQHNLIPDALERLGEVVFFDLPDEKALKARSDDLIRRIGLSKTLADEVVNNLKGLTLFEVEQAYAISIATYDEIKLEFIRDFKKNSIAKTDLLSLENSNIKFNDIGGLHKLKEWLKMCYGGWTVEGQKFGLPILKGVLMVGIPGCGKSLIMKALGNEWGLPVVRLDPSRIFSSRVGDSESNMRRVLKLIENMSPCVLVVDEIEKGLAGMDSSTFSDSGVTARVIGNFLIWMQDCEKPVFTVATANNIQYLPPELISRFDETFFVNLPQDFERQEIFNIHIKKLNRDPSKFDLKAMAEASKDMAGREIEQVLKEAMYKSFSAKQDLNTQAILDVLSRKTSILNTMGEQLKFMLKWVGWDEEKQDGVRARFASSPNPLDIARVNSEIDKLLGDLEGGPTND